MTSTGFGLLSLVTFFPLAGALSIGFLSKEATRNARWIALYTTLFTLGASVFLWASFEPGNAGFQFVEEMDWLGGSINYKMGVDGISVLFVVLTAFLMPLCILASWKSIEDARQGVHDRLPGARDADDRRLLRARPRALLPVLRGRPDPDVPDHRHLGRQAARLRQLQVLPLHAAGLRADAARHDGDVLARRHHRHPHAADPQVPRGHAVVAVARLLRLVRREDADVAGAHLAARRARGGADGGLRHPRRHPAEDGRLRLPALLAADVSDRQPGVRALGVRARRWSPSSTPRWSRWRRRT